MTIGVRRHCYKLADWHVSGIRLCMQPVCKKTTFIMFQQVEKKTMKQNNVAYTSEET